MNIVKIIKDSFQEYPPYHSLVLFTQGCNLNCSFCYNKEIVNSYFNIIEKNLYQILEENITPLHEAIVFCGGEPTIPEDIISDIEDICKVGYPNLKIKIFTNGMESEPIELLSQYGLVDSWSFDFKCLYNRDKILGINYPGYSYIPTLIESINYCIENNQQVEIRTTKNEFVDDKHVEEIFKFLQYQYGDKIIKINDMKDIALVPKDKIPHIVQNDLRPFLES